jgi:Baseplate J-like protein
MQTVDEKPETIHLYVVREKEPHPPIFPIVLSVFALLVLVVIGVALPYQQPEERKTIRIPAVFLPVKSFTTSVVIIPTGVKVFPATKASGPLTLTNGSVIEATLPKGIILTGMDGIEVVTDAAVFIPAGSAAGYGVASVSAHAAISGKSGNIHSFDINRVEGTSIYIRNLAAFHGGRDANSVKVVTDQDRQTAMDTARSILTSQEATIRAFLAKPCNESVTSEKSLLQLSWACQFVTYTIPSYMNVVSVRLVGSDLLIDVRFVARPGRMWVK